MYRAYRFRLRPTAERKVLLARLRGCARFVCSRVWAMSLPRLAGHARCLWCEEADGWLKRWKHARAYGFRTAAPSHVPQQKPRDRDKAMRDAFDPAGPDRRPPRLEQRGRDDAIRFPDPAQIHLERRRIKAPKLGWVSFYQNQAVSGGLKHVTVSPEGGPTGAVQHA